MEKKDVAFLVGRYVGGRGGGMGEGGKGKGKGGMNMVGKLETGKKG